MEEASPPDAVEKLCLQNIWNSGVAELMWRPGET
jgi:hypothetical protein